MTANTAYSIIIYSLISELFLGTLTDNKSKRAFYQYKCAPVLRLLDLLDLIIHLLRSILSLKSLNRLQVVSRECKM